MEGNSVAYKLSPLWQRAIIGGSIWGALEITLGSVLHNLMVPMAAGTLLASLGVLTVSAISAPAIQRGFFWRAALICALLKSVSPSAVILPPMVGIALEGVLMELGLLILGTNVLGLLLGGGLALLSIPLFKAIRLYMIYGQGIVEFFNSLLIQLTGSDNVIVTNYLIYTLLIIYLSLGIISALIGYSLGKNNLPIAMNPIEITVFARVGNNLNFRTYLLLIIHIIVLVSYLAFASVLPTWFAILGGGLYSTLVLTYYERPRRMLLKPIFILPVLAFAFFIPLITTKLILVPMYGSYIFVRAIFVVVTLAAIGTELAKPSVSQLFSRGFLSPVYYASSMAFNALPIYLEAFEKSKFTASSMLKSIQGVINNSSWCGNRPIFIITGGLGEGKSTYLENLLEIFGKEKGLSFKGFIARGIGAPPLREGYNLWIIPDGTDLMLCRRIGTCGLPNKSFEFNDGVIGRLTTDLAAINADDILVIDEVGRMELYGEVWAGLIEHHLTKTKNVLILTVRRENLMHVVERWNLTDAYVFDINKVGVTDAANSIKNLVLSYHAASSRK
ncbi:MAG: nucleoside-triphosphatase [Tenuifilum sp.]|uniref:nucleoside-triphosphatase n=1 Tax=Tenuifilum sp. TaxID=2760880 RepID=UPI0030A059CA